MSYLDYFFTPKKSGGRLDFVCFCVYFLPSFMRMSKPITTIAIRAAMPNPKTYVSVCGAGVGVGAGVGSGASTTPM